MEAKKVKVINSDSEKIMLFNDIDSFGLSPNQTMLSIFSRHTFTLPILLCFNIHHRQFSAVADAGIHHP